MSVKNQLQAIRDRAIWASDIATWHYCQHQLKLEKMYPKHERTIPMNIGRVLHELQAEAEKCHVLTDPNIVSRMVEAPRTVLELFQRNLMKLDLIEENFKHYQSGLAKNRDITVAENFWGLVFTDPPIFGRADLVGIEQYGKRRCWVVYERKKTLLRKPDGRLDCSTGHRLQTCAYVRMLEVTLGVGGLLKKQNCMGIIHTTDDRYDEKTRLRIWLTEEDIRQLFKDARQIDQMKSGKYRPKGADNPRKCPPCRYREKCSIKRM